MTPEHESLRTVLDEAPFSIRAIAEKMGLSHTTLRLIRDGDRRLTEENRQALISALREWGEQCFDLAKLLEEEAPNG